MDLGSLVMPLGANRGTTNAVMFGVALLALRDSDLSLLPKRLPPKMTHHDMDAPPWWHFHRKRFLYIDGFAPKAHRPLMQFMLVEQNGPAEFQEWEADYQHVFAYIASISAPRFPFAVDHATAEQGRQVFNQHCAECHGTYGPEGSYPERRVDWVEVRTDPVRLQALTPFHNGSVPSLWHVLHPNQRPTVWRRREANYDTSRVGLAVVSLADLPADLVQRPHRREYFDTRRLGKSAAGHDFAEALTEAEKTQVLEYLKTL
jgi:hypothetical protein